MAVASLSNPHHILLRHGRTNVLRCTQFKVTGMQTQTLLHLWTSYFLSKLVSSSSVMPGSLNVTFPRELVLMLAVRLRLGLCSGLERECLMTGEGSVAAGHTSHGGERVVEGFEPPALMASSQDKLIILLGEGQDFSHTSLALSHDTQWSCFCYSWSSSLSSRHL